MLIDASEILIVWTGVIKFSRMMRVSSAFMCAILTGECVYCFSLSVWRRDRFLFFLRYEIRMCRQSMFLLGSL